MAQRTEFLSGGLVTARDPSLLAEGEVQQAEDVLLKPGSPSVFKAPGRNNFNTIPIASVSGLTYCPFDNATDRVVAAAGGSYQAAPAGTGVFSTLASGAGTTLASVSMTNRSALLSGGTNKVLLPDGTARPIGLMPVIDPPGLSHAGPGAGTWPLGGTQLGWFEYWTTEVYKVGNEEVESTFTGTPAQVDVLYTTSTVTITKPSSVNPTYTHWRIYRSNKRTNSTDISSFPIGFLIGTVDKATSTFVDGGGSTFGLAIAGVGESTGALPGQTDGGSWDFTAGNITIDDGSPATSATVQEYVSSAGNVIPRYSAMIARTFTFSGIGNPITDVTIQVKAKVNSDAGLRASITTDGGVTWTVYQTFDLTSSFTTQSKGGIWNRGWVAADFTDSLFRVRLEAFGRHISTSGSISVDFLKVSVAHGGTTADQSVQFPRIVITAGPVQGSFGANSPPPSANTGDIFQGSLVMNDMANPREAAWTIPGTLDYSPTIYRMAFDWPVRNIKSLGSACLIGQSAQVERLNYLPLEDDPEFNTGRAKDIVDSDDGISGPMAACKFTLGGRLYVFYTGFTSLRMTDGFQAQSATDDIIWPDIYGSANLYRAIVINNALYHEIQVYYGTKMLRLSYDPTHLKGSPTNPKLKVVGITNYAASAATFGISDSDQRVVYTGRTDGFVYVENSGHTDASGGGIRPVVVSREIHEGGMASGWELDALGVHHPNNDGAAAQVSYISSLANYPDRVTPTTPVAMSARTLSMITQGDTGDGLAIKLTGTDDDLPWTVDYVTLFSGQMGDTAPLKR